MGMPKKQWKSCLSSSSSERSPNLRFLGGRALVNYGWSWQTRERSGLYGTLFSSGATPLKPRSRGSSQLYFRFCYQALSVMIANEVADSLSLFQHCRFRAMVPLALVDPTVVFLEQWNLGGER